MGRWIGVAVVLSLFAGTAAAAAGRDRRRKDNSPAVGDVAPDFDLVRLDVFLKANAPSKGAPQSEPTPELAEPKKASSDEAPGSPATSEPTETERAEPANVKLSEFRGKRPVVLIFASYT